MNVVCLYNPRVHSLGGRNPFGRAAAEQSAAQRPIRRSAKLLRPPDSECIARECCLLNPKTLPPGRRLHLSVVRRRTEAAPVLGTRSPMPTAHGQWPPAEDPVLVSLLLRRARSRRLHLVTLPGLGPGQIAERPHWTKVPVDPVAPAKEESGRSRRTGALAPTESCLCHGQG